jgi:hypothetical protein
MALTLGIILFTIIAGALYVQPTNWSGFFPYGFSGTTIHDVGGDARGASDLQRQRGGDVAGTLRGAAVVFFAYIGFDTVSTLYARSHARSHAHTHIYIYIHTHMHRETQTGAIILAFAQCAAPPCPHRHQPMGV